MLRFIIIVILGGFFQSAKAHTVDSVLLSFQETEDSWRVQILLDASLAVVELRDDESPQPNREWLYDQTPEGYRIMRAEAEVFLRQAVSFTHRGESAFYDVSFPDFATSPLNFPTLLNGGAYLTVEIVGELNGEAGEFVIHVPSASKYDIIVALGDDENISYMTVEPGGAELVFATTSSGITKVEKRGAYSLLKLGYLHVIPDGFDHILFILCLFLMARQWRPLLSQSLVFTVAHSLTLGLAVSGGIQLEQWSMFFTSLIEPLIAVSILVLAVENILRKKASKTRYLMVFIFGLIHGLGFAGSLGSALQQAGSWVFPLALANIGVELAQVSVLVIAWVLTIRIARLAHYESFQKASSVLIAAIALWMIVERVLI